MYFQSVKLNLKKTNISHSILKKLLSYSPVPGIGKMAHQVPEIVRHYSHIIETVITIIFFFF